MRARILEAIEKHWPLSITQLSQHLGLKWSDERQRKAAIAKISYHIKKLKKENKIYTKKIGQSLVVWSMDIEKLRMLHEFMKEI